MTFTRIFVLEQKFAYARGAQAVFLGGTGLEMHSSGTGAFTLFWCTIFGWEAQFSFGGGTSSDLGRVQTQNAPMGPGLHFTSLQTL